MVKMQSFWPLTPVNVYTVVEGEAILLATGDGERGHGEDVILLATDAGERGHGGTKERQSFWSLVTVSMDR